VAWQLDSYDPPATMSLWRCCQRRAAAAAHGLVRWRSLTGCRRRGRSRGKGDGSDYGALLLVGREHAEVTVARTSASLRLTVSFQEYRKTATGLGYGPSLRGDERQLDEQHRPFMFARRLRAIEPTLGQLASTPAVDPLLTYGEAESGHRNRWKLPFRSRQRGILISTCYKNNRTQNSVLAVQTLT
jgi:hypothetical protein